MAVPEIELRVAALEAKVEEIQRYLQVVAPDTRPWWEHVVGAFANDQGHCHSVALIVTAQSIHSALPQRQSVDQALRLVI